MPGMASSGSFALLLAAEETPTVWPERTCVKRFVSYTLNRRIRCLVGEKRRCTRFRLHGEARFAWEDPQGERREGTGLIRDMARTGAYIESKTIPPASTPLRVVVTLTSSSPDGMHARLSGIGIVRHVQFEGNCPVGFGASVAFHTEAATEER